MLAQLAQRSSHSVDGHNVDAINPTRTDDRVDDPIAIASGTIASPSSIPISPRSSSAGGPDLKLEDATAVSNHWMGSSLLLSSPSRFGNDADPKGETAIARPCSSLSLAGLGDLCGDEEAQDDCGGAFLVADCDDVNGSGIGLDLYDLGQVHLLVKLPRLQWKMEAFWPCGRRNEQGDSSSKGDLIFSVCVEVEVIC